MQLAINRAILFDRLQEENPNRVQRGRGLLEKSGGTGLNMYDPMGDERAEWTCSLEAANLRRQLDLAVELPYGDDYKKSVPKPIRHLIEGLEDLGQNDKIHVIKADKGGTVVVVNKETYDHEALTQLKDNNVYRELSLEEANRELKRIAIATAAIAKRLFGEGCINTREQQFFADRARPDAKLYPAFLYFLPKIHKSPKWIQEDELLRIDGRTFGRAGERVPIFSARPIAATYACPVRPLDQYITELTKPLLSLIPGSLRDTTDLLNRLPKERLDRRARIFSADVVALYPNIPWEEGIAAATRFYREQFENLRALNKTAQLLPPPPPRLFRECLKMVVENSVVSLKGQRHFLQISGTAMGACISVYLANTYMYSLTRNVLEEIASEERHEWIEFLLRFIDDLFLVIKYDPGQEILEDFLRARIGSETIKYTYTEICRTVAVLDVQVTINEKTQLIETHPYSKPTSKPTYLHYDSRHPGHTADSLPYAQFLRLKRIASDEETFITHSKVLAKSLRLRGYPDKIIVQCFGKANKTKREEILVPVAERAGEPANDSVAKAWKFITTYSPAIDDGQIKGLLSQLVESIVDFYSHEVAGVSKEQRQIALKTLEDRRIVPVYKIGVRTINRLVRSYKKPRLEERP